jgi:hypothetical protein
MIHILKHVRFMVCAFALLAPQIYAQSDGIDQQSAQQAAPAQQPAPPAQQPTAPPSPTVTPDNTPGGDVTVKTPRYAFGFRIEYFPQRFFETQYVTANTTNPILSTGYFGTSAGAKLAYGLTGEFRLNDHISLGLDFFRHQEEYTQLAQIKSGLLDPTSSYDNRPLTSVTLDTRMEYWDIPVVARYYGWAKKGPRGLGWVAQTYFLGGGTFRHVSDIRTGTSTSLPDGSTSYNEIPATPIHNNLIGVLGGFGYKLFEYGKFKSMIEARYTRWFEYTFEGPAYKSTKNQVELGLSFTY